MRDTWQEYLDYMEGVWEDRRLNDEWEHQCAFGREEI